MLIIIQIILYEKHLKSITNDNYNLREQSIMHTWSNRLGFNSLYEGKIAF